MRIPQMTPPSVLSSYVRRDQVRAALIQGAGGMVRVRPVGVPTVFSLGRVAGLALWGDAASLARSAGCPTGMCRRHRAARSKRCARPSDLHPDGRIAGLLARMRATPPAGSARRPPPGYAAQRGQRPRVPGGGRYGRNLRAR